MGAGASAQVLQSELNKPLDGSDLEGGACLAEVRRLRDLLRASYDAGHTEPALLEAVVWDKVEAVADGRCRSRFERPGQVWPHSTHAGRATVRFTGNHEAAVHGERGPGSPGHGGLDSSHLRRGWRARGDLAPAGGRWCGRKP